MACSGDNSGPCRMPSGWAKERRIVRSTPSSRPIDAMVLITDVPTPARCASSAAGSAGPSFNCSSTRRRALVSFSAASSLSSRAAR